MVEKTVSSRFKIVGRSMKCKGGHSVVEQSAYISRTTMKSEYDGRTYYPKYSEDLVHVEISLPEGAPEAYKDRSVLWNSVEMFEKRKDAQYGRTNRFPLPNDWSYETAVTVMRDYIRRNFVSKGMCCEWAVHDSEERVQRILANTVLNRIDDGRIPQNVKDWAQETANTFPDNIYDRSLVLPDSIHSGHLSMLAEASMERASNERKYELGDMIEIDGDNYIIENIGLFNVELRDPTQTYPVFRRGR